MPKKYESYFIGKCDNCHEENKKIRRVEAMGMFKEPRGFYNICFDCMGPRVMSSNRRGTFHSPTNKIRGKDGLEKWIRTSSESTPSPEPPSQRHSLPMTVANSEKGQESNRRDSTRGKPK